MTSNPTCHTTSSTPVITIERGQPIPEEIAALVAVLAAKGPDDDPGVNPASAPRLISAWSCAEQLRGQLRLTGRFAWRAN